MEVAKSQEIDHPVYPLRSRLGGCGKSYTGGRRARSGVLVCLSVKPVGEPDAANPHVRFDEREVETEHGQLLGHRQPKGPATRKATLPHRATSRLYPILFPCFGTIPRLTTNSYYLGRH